MSTSRRAGRAARGAVQFNVPVPFFTCRFPAVRLAVGALASICTVGAIGAFAPATPATPATTSFPVASAPTPRSSGAPQFQRAVPGVPQGLMPHDNTAVISGTVIDASTGRHVPHAVVRLTGRAAFQTRLSDDDGQFAFMKLPAGTYSVTATKAGFFDGAFGKMRADGAGVPLAVENGQWFGHAGIALFRPATIAGTVVDEANEPVVGVRVQALRRLIIAGRARLLPGPSALTDDLGDYRLLDLPPGEYVVSVPSVRITLSTQGISALIALGGGGLTSDLETVVNNNLHGAFFDTFVGPSEARTSADGQNLVIGGQATARPMTKGPAKAYPSLYFPNAQSVSSALQIDVDSAEHRAGIDFQLQPVPICRVSGRLDGPDGSSLGEVLRLIPEGADDAGFGTETATTIADFDGTFTFLDVPAGRYRIEARSSVSMLVSAGDTSHANALQSISSSPVTTVTSFEASGAAAAVVTASVTGLLGLDQPYWGDADVVVDDRDVTDVVVPLETAKAIHGRVEIEAGGPPWPTGAETRIRVVAEPADGSAAAPAPAHINASGEFAVLGTTAGRYYIRATGLPSGWSLKSAMWQNNDLSTTPLDTTWDVEATDVVVTLTGRPSQVSGTVRDARGLLAVPLSTVIVFPASRGDLVDYGLNPRRLQTTRAGVDGTFHLVGLPPGVYNLVAIDEGAAEGWQDSDRLDTWRGVATRITIGDGDQKTQDLRLQAHR